MTDSIFQFLIDLVQDAAIVALSFAVIRLARASR